MVRSLVLDLSTAEREALEQKHTFQRLSLLSEKPQVVFGNDVKPGSGDLFVTENQNHAMAAAAHGATVWRVQQGTGELESWEDLPLAMAFNAGTLGDLNSVLNQLPEFHDDPLVSVSWTRQGDVSGSTKAGRRVFVTAGPDGETPRISLGQEAESREKEANSFFQTLLANNQVSFEDAVGSGQTHSLTSGAGLRPKFKRHGYNVSQSMKSN